jgi:hypothetical protein
MMISKMQIDNRKGNNGVGNWNVITMHIYGFYMHSLQL